MQLAISPWVIVVVGRSADASSATASPSIAIGPGAAKANRWSGGI